MTPNFSPYAIDSLWLDPVPKPRTLLVAYPHPDDESFGNGGTRLADIACVPASALQKLQRK